MNRKVFISLSDNSCPKNELVKRNKVTATMFFIIIILYQNCFLFKLNLTRAIANKRSKSAIVNQQSLIKIPLFPLRGLGAFHF